PAGRAESLSRCAPPPASVFWQEGVCVVSRTAARASGPTVAVVPASPRAPAPLPNLLQSAQAGPATPPPSPPPGAVEGARAAAPVLPSLKAASPLLAASDPVRAALRPHSPLRPGSSPRAEDFQSAPEQPCPGPKQRRAPLPGCSQTAS